MLDRYWLGSTSRISPEAPVPVVKVQQAEERPGGAGNVALNIAALGGKASLISLVGDDDNANLLTKILQAQSVDCSFITIKNSDTITKLRILSRHQQLIRLDFEDGFSGFEPGKLESKFSAALPQSEVVVLSDYDKGTLSDIESLIEAAKAAGKSIVVDPKGSDFERYRNATIITPNMSEFEAVVGHCETDEDVEVAGEALREKLNLTALLITRSEKGMTLLQADEEPLHLATHAREVFDVTGAGDTVVAVLSAGLAAGLSLAQSTFLANIAAGIVVGKIGTATASLDEISAAMMEHELPGSGVLSEGELLKIVSQAHDNNETVVMTNGCFDLLHLGHVDYLQRARALGDYLIVAVNDDASVKQLKGESRPLNVLEARMQMLAALACVDWVVSFSEATPERLYCAVKPDVLVKGGDYAIDEIAGGKCVQAAGGEVKVLNFVEGYSTTSLIEKMQKG